MPGIVGQIMILDIIFSLDSVITAVGMAEHIEVMVTAVIIAIGVMLVFAKQIGDFINKYPSMKILALSFLLLIGVLLTAEGPGATHQQGLHLLRDGFRSLGGAAEHPLSCEARGRRKRVFCCG